MGAAAAVLLIFIWTLGFRPRGPSQPALRKDFSSQSVAPLDAKGPASSAKDDSAQAAQEAEEKAADAVAGEAASGDTYAASDFVPVPFTGAIAPDDPGMVVRVQLTRASLAQLGYPVAAAPDDDLIQADVLVGEDGWPRGVKLVQ